MAGGSLGLLPWGKIPLRLHRIHHRGGFYLVALLESVHYWLYVALQPYINPHHLRKRPNSRKKLMFVFSARMDGLSAVASVP